MAEKRRINGRYSYEGDFSKGFNKDNPKDVSKAIQSFAKEVNINNIIKRYKKTGILVDPLTGNARVPFFGDFSSGADLLEVQSKIAKVKETFACLPADVRDRFKNDPSVMLDFVNDPKNLVEAVKLGLLPKSLLPVIKEEVASPDPVKDPATPPA